MAETKTAPAPATETTKADAAKAALPTDGLSQDAIVKLFSPAYLASFGGVGDVSVVKDGVRCTLKGEPLETKSGVVSTAAKRIRNGFRIRCKDGKIVSYNSDAGGEVSRETQMPFARGVDTGFAGFGARFLKFDAKTGREFWIDDANKRHDVDPASGKVIA